MNLIPNKLLQAAKSLKTSYRLVRHGKKKLKERIRVAVIGTGKAGRYHLHALSNIEGVEISCIVNRGRSDPRPLMKSYSILESYDNISKAISKCKFDVAIVAVNPTSTFEVAKILIENDINCLIEKPLGINIDEASALKQLASSKKVIVAVGYNRRFYSSVMAAYDYVKFVGRPYSIHIDAPEDIVKLLQRSDSENVRRWLISRTTHAIDLFTLFGGEYADVSSIEHAKYYDGIQSDFMSFIRFSHGQTGSFISHWRSPGDWLIMLYGDNYKLTIDLIQNKLFSYTKKRAHLMTQVSETDLLFKAGIYLQNYNFLNCVIEQKQPEPPLASINDAFQSLKLADNIINTSWAKHLKNTNDILPGSKPKNK